MLETIRFTIRGFNGSLILTIASPLRGRDVRVVSCNRDVVRVVECATGLNVTARFK